MQMSISSIIQLVEEMFPGAAALISQYLATLTVNTIVKAVMIAMRDWQEGKDFLAILKDELDALKIAQQASANP